jgi:hypothetical protein
MATSTLDPAVFKIITTPRKRRPRGDSQYSRQELGILNTFKSEYRSKLTYQDREVLVRTEVFVAIFNYWDRQGISFQSETEVLQRMEVCVTIYEE